MVVALSEGIADSYDKEREACDPVSPFVVAGTGDGGPMTFGVSAPIMLPDASGRNDISLFQASTNHP